MLKIFGLLKVIAFLNHVNQSFSNRTKSKKTLFKESTTREKYNGYEVSASVHKNLKQVDNSRLLVQDKVDIDVGSLLGKLLKDVRKNFFLPNLPQQTSGHRQYYVANLILKERLYRSMLIL